MKVAAGRLRLGRPARTPFHSRALARRRRQPSTPELIGAGVLVVAVVALVSYVIRRRLYQAVAVMAEAVEEVADTVEDAAEDLAEAAEARAKGDGAAD
jgi:hypothetical protein